MDMLKTFKSSLGKGFSACDGFREPAHFYIGKKAKQASCFSGFITISIFILVMIAAISFLNDIMERRSPIIRDTIIDGRYPPLELNRSRFMFAVGIQGLNATELTPYFEVKLVNVTFLRNEDGTRKKSYYDNLLLPCTEKDFQLEGRNFSKEYQKFLLKDYLCPNVSSFFINGSYTSDVFKFLQINFAKCNSSRPENTCLPEAELNAKLGNQSFRMSLFYTDLVVNVEDFEAPVEFNLLDQFWWFMPYRFSKSVDMFVNQFLIKSNSRILPSFSQIWDTPFPNDTLSGVRIPYEKIREQSFQDPKAPFLSINLRLDQFEHEYFRSYANITNLLYKIGGTTSFLVLILGYIARKYNALQARASIAGEIYEFDQEDQGNLEKIQTGEIVAIKERGHTDLERSLIKNGSTSPRSEAQDVVNEKVKSLHQRFENQHKKEKILKSIYPKALFYRFCCCCLSRCRKKPNARVIYEQAEKKLRQDIDIIEVIKKMQEFQKLKTILLTESQLKVFESTPQPKLFKTKKVKKGRRLSEVANEKDVTSRVLNYNKNQGSDELSNFKQLCVAYDQACRNKELEQSESLEGLISRGVKRLLGSDIQRILESACRNKQIMDTITGEVVSLMRSSEDNEERIDVRSKMKTSPEVEQEIEQARIFHNESFAETVAFNGQGDSEANAKNASRYAIVLITFVIWKI